MDSVLNVGRLSLSFDRLLLYDSPPPVVKGSTRLSLAGGFSKFVEISAESLGPILIYFRLVSTDSFQGDGWGFLLEPALLLLDPIFFFHSVS